MFSGGALRGVERRIINNFRTRPAVYCGAQSVKKDLPKLQPFTRCYSDQKPESKKDRAERLQKEVEDLNKKGAEIQGEGTSVKDGQIDEAISGEFVEKQARTPWHREGAEARPVDKLEHPPKEMAKGKDAYYSMRDWHEADPKAGKLLTTPSRLLKLVLPLTALDNTSDHKNIEPLALVVHPQQPLSYLERLIQSELPLIRTKDGKDKVPEVWFRAEDSVQEDEFTGKASVNSDQADSEDAEVETGTEKNLTGIHGEDEKVARDEELSKGNLKSADVAKSLRGGPGEGGIETYSGLGHDSPKPNNAEPKFVRWSSSTEIGDFIRDAARGREFAVEIEGARKEIRVGVPSFSDRTHYLRVRLRKTAKTLDGMTRLKIECDKAAHKSAQRLAMGGFGVLASWWFGVYHFTFQTGMFAFRF